MRQTTKEFMDDLRLCIEHGDLIGIEQAINHPKMLYSTLALGAVARTGDVALLEHVLEQSLGATIMDLTSVFKNVVQSGEVKTTQYLLEWAQSNNTFDAPNPYLRTVLMAAVDSDCVEIWRNNAHQVHSIPHGLMKTYYFKAVEQESLRCLEYFKEHMDTELLLVQGMDLAVDKLKTASIEYFLQRNKNPSARAGSIAVQVCLKHNLSSCKGVVSPEITSVLLMLMDHASPEQMLTRFAGVSQSHPLHAVLDHINTTVRAQQQSERLNVELNEVQLKSVSAARKL